VSLSSESGRPRASPRLRAQNGYRGEWAGPGADTGARKLSEQMRQIGADHFMGMFHKGNFPHRMVFASLDLFHKEVMPQLDGIKVSVPAS